VSICGGEPLIYPKIEELIAGLHEQGRVIYVCTNGVFQRKSGKCGTKHRPKSEMRNPKSETKPRSLARL